MRHYFYIFCLLFATNILGQTKGKLIKKHSLKAKHFVGCDYDFNYYFFSNTILSKQTKSDILTYSNFLYGNISSVDITNPLKIVVFYKEFNVVILLDSQLNETDIIQLPYDVSFANKGTANHLWLFTTNTKIIENFNFKTQTVVAKSQPLKNATVVNMKSTENNVFIQTTDGIRTFDYLGNFIKNYDNTKLQDFQYSNRILYTLQNDTIYRNKKNIETITFSKPPNIQKFYTLNNHFFIFDGSELYLFSTDKK